MYGENLDLEQNICFYQSRSPGLGFNGGSPTIPIIKKCVVHYSKASKNYKE